jgi:hypothetical protein
MGNLETHGDDFEFVDFDYIPAVIVKPKNPNSILSRYYAVILEAYKNGFGESVSFRKHQNRAQHANMNRGDTNHRVGKILSIKEHDDIVNSSYVGFEDFCKKITSQR